MRRRSVGRLTSTRPASANTLGVPTCNSSAITFFAMIGYASMARAPRSRAKATAARASAPAHAALTEARTGEQACDRPHGVVGLVLVATVPRDTKDAQQTFVCGARLDRTPPDGFSVEIRDEPARRV